VGLVIDNNIDLTHPLLNELGGVYRGLRRYHLLFDGVG